MRFQKCNLRHLFFKVSCNGNLILGSAFCSASSQSFTYTHKTHKHCRSRKQTPRRKATQLTTVPPSFSNSRCFFTTINLFYIKRGELIPVLKYHAMTTQKDDGEEGKAPSILNLSIRRRCVVTDKLLLKRWRRKTSLPGPGSPVHRIHAD